LFIVVGDFIDAVPAIIIFMPIILKLTEVGQINPLHMGVVIITTLVFGLITPPYGLSLLVASKYVGVGFGRALRRSLRLYIVFIATIALIVLFPDLVLWLPTQLLPEAVGAATGAVAAGAAMGSIGGPVGAAVGAAVGGVAGAWAGKEIADSADPRLEDDYWRENWESRSYIDGGFSYDQDYGPAYRYGV